MPDWKSYKQHMSNFISDMLSKTNMKQNKQKAAEMKAANMSSSSQTHTNEDFS